MKTPLSCSKSIKKINPKSVCSKSRSKIATRQPKTLPRCPSDPPGHPKMPSRTHQDDPKCLPKSLQGPS